MPGTITVLVPTPDGLHKLYEGEPPTGWAPYHTNAAEHVDDWFFFMPGGMADNQLNELADSGHTGLVTAEGFGDGTLVVWQGSPRHVWHKYSGRWAQLA